jgi:hypothetical protein
MRDTILVSALALAACVTAAPPAPAIHYSVFVDRSGSPLAIERARWRTEADALVARLQPGDAIDVYALHARTTDAGALFSRDTKAAPADDATLQETLDARNAIARLRADATAALHAALDGPDKTDGTDVVGFVERVARASGRRQRVVIFSDAIHETPDLNLARTRLAADRIDRHVDAVIRRFGWSRDRLAGAEVGVVLNAAPPSAEPPLNDRRMLRRFYAALVERLGARLVTFDTQLAFPN